MEREQLILVDHDDMEIGTETKEKCHYKQPILHRALSVFIFNDSGQMLVTKRSSKKKTWPGFWSNSCCSHPRKGEETEKAAQRRIREELGIDVPLTYLFKFEYSAQFNEDWGENELDWVFIGKHNGPFRHNRDEIDEWQFVDVEELKRDVKKHPNRYTPWFKLCFERVLENLKK